jgi:hypothetical protein
MRTTADFHEQFIAAAIKAVATKMPYDWHGDEWEELVAPFYNQVRTSIETGLASHEWGGPVMLTSGMTRHPDTGQYIEDGLGARVYASVAFMPDDADPDYVESAQAMLHDVILGQYPDCVGSTLDIIAAIEKSCAIAREKLAAK